ncbi:MAG: MATE family efflux transporter, partial [Clostridiales bacterium]|nr:MATE family efflux transporter [Clostridiales bacterium]
MTSLKENKMGVMPVGKLLFTMALPMALSMLVQALYNVVDSVFVSRISEADNFALTAVSLAFPVQNIMIGVATGIAIGVNALLSRGLGERDSDQVNRSALNGIFLAFVSMLLFVLFGIFGAEIYMRSITPDAQTVAYGTDYIRIISIVSFGIFGEILFERLLQSTGRTAYTMLTQGIGAIINIILDPILIFGWFGLPRMEVKGAAVATVVGQI